MEGKEAIINKIISDAEKKASSIVDKASFDGKLLVSDAEKWAQDYISFEKEQLKKQQDEIVKRRLTVAELDKRKILLKKKQQLIDEIINEIYQKMLKTDKKKYLEFVEKNIEASCDNNDEIILSKDNVLNKEDILQLKIVKEKNLTVRNEIGEFLGGVKLVGKISDKDLTFKAILESKRSQMVSEIAEKLFN